MRLILITLIIIFAATAINWMRDGDWHIAKAFPLLGGYEPSFYDCAGFVMLLIAVRGYLKIRRNQEP